MMVLIFIYQHNWCHLLPLLCVNIGRTNIRSTPVFLETPGRDMRPIKIEIINGSLHRLHFYLRGRQGVYVCVRTIPTVISYTISERETDRQRATWLSYLIQPAVLIFLPHYNIDATYQERLAPLWSCLRGSGGEGGSEENSKLNIKDASMLAMHLEWDPYSNRLFCI